MLLNRHTALQVACLYAIVAAVYIPGSVLSARRHNTHKSEQHVQKAAPSIHAHKSLKTARNSAIPEQAAARRPNEHSFPKPVPVNSVGGADFETAYRIPADMDIINTYIRVIKSGSHISLPGYYAFLFRYVLF